MKYLKLSIFLIILLYIPYSFLTSGNILDFDFIRKFAGWETIRFDNTKTINGDGSEFRIYYRKGSENNLIVHFSGGGACWDYDSTSQPITALDAIAVQAFGKEVLTGCKQNLWPQIIPNGLKGIFEKDDTNPFRNWHVVFIPYTTGDFHIGKSPNKIYEKDGEPSQTEAINHSGFYNTSQALKWIESRNFNLQKVIVSGDSAGALASIYWGREFNKIYPSSNIYQISDGFSLVINDAKSFFKKAWNVDTQDEFGVDSEDNLVLPAFLSYLKSDYKNDKMKHLHINSIYDDILIGFSSTLFNVKKGSEIKKEWSQTMLQTTKKLSESELNYNYFISDYGLNDKGYTAHTNILSDGYIENKHKDTSLKQWLVDNIINDKNTSIGEEYFDRSDKQ